MTAPSPPRSPHDLGVVTSREQTRRDTEAALEGLDATLGAASAPLEPEALTLALRVVGDALRLGLDLPRGVRGWLRSATHGSLAEATARLPATLVAPPDLEGVEQGHPTRQRFVQALDEAESIDVAVLRATLPNDPEPPLDRALDVLARAKHDAVAWVRKNVSLEEAVDALGTRVELAPTWLESLSQNASAEPLAADDVLRRVRTGPPLHEPTDEVVDAFLRRGALAAYVSAEAARNHAFMETLRTMVDELAATHEPLSLLAYKLVRGTVPVAVRKAAATGALDVDSLDLGHLGSIDAHVRLTIDDEQVAVHVYPEKPGEVRRVTLGDQSTTAELDGKLRVALRGARGTVHLSVEGRSGSRVDVDLEIGT